MNSTSSISLNPSTSFSPCSGLWVNMVMSRIRASGSGRTMSIAPILPPRSEIFKVTRLSTPTSLKSLSRTITLLLGLWGEELTVMGYSRYRWSRWMMAFWLRSFSELICFLFSRNCFNSSEERWQRPTPILFPSELQSSTISLLSK